MLMKREIQHVATFSNCGKPLRAFTTTFIWRQIKGTRFMVEPNGKNVKDWAIRREASFCLFFVFVKRQKKEEPSETKWKWGFDLFFFRDEREKTEKSLDI